MGFPGGPVVRICLPVQETQIPPLTWEDPTCHEATKCTCHSTEPVLCSPCLATRGVTTEKPTHLNQRVAPACHS